MFNTKPAITPAMLAADPILSFFAFTHLPAALQDVSAPFHNLAVHVAGSLPRNAERTVALRKLLEAKDAAVRANIGAMASGNLVGEETFFDRLKSEHAELNARLYKLSVFLRDCPDAVDATQREMLKLQAGHMTEYLAILAARIENIEHATQSQQSARAQQQGQSDDSFATLSNERRPVHEGLEAEPAVRETGEHDPVRDGPIKFED